MNTPLLQTKLYIPSPRPNLVRRPRLIEQLNEGLQHKLILISAPAGFGKTTLVSEWLLQIDRPVVWLSLDEGDNDLIRWLTYLVAALQQVGPEIGQTTQSLLRTPQPPPFETLVATFVNEIAAASSDLVLVLDDFHFVTDPLIHQAMGFLLKHLPPQLHLVMTTRRDPFLPLSRLRARGQMIEVRADDLRFSSQETSAFLKQALGLTLSPGDVAALDDRTEGWITGLHLAALSLQRHQQSGGAAGQFIAEFAGDDRLMADYLIDEILAQRPVGTRDFLLKTAVLRRMTGPLCNAVTQQEGGQQVLEQLEQANLLVVPLDNRRQWYRYHHLFADFLRQQLSQTYPDQIAELHQRAAAWYTQLGLIVEAIPHVLAADDFEQAANLINSISEAMLSRGEVVTLLSWLNAFPNRLLSTDPRLGVVYAWGLWATGRFAQAEEWAQVAAKAISSIKTSNTQDLSGQVAALLSTIAASQRQAERALALCQQALNNLNDDNQFFRAIVIWNQAFAYRLEDKPQAAQQAYTDAIALSQAVGNVSFAVLASIGLGNLQVAQNNLYQAEDTFRRALDMASGRGIYPLPAAIEAYLGLAQLFYEWNKLDTAHKYVQLGLQLSQQLGNIDLQIPLMIVQANLQSQDNLADALATLRRAKQLVDQYKLDRRANDVVAALVTALIRRGDLAEAEQLTWVYALPISQARVLLAKDNSSQANAALEPLRQQAELKGYDANLLRIIVLQAVALEASGQMHQAGQILAEALVIAEPGGCIRTFVDEGEPIARLLNSLQGQGGRAYIHKLLAAFGQTEQLPSPSFNRQPLVEPLSNRELEVLHLMAEGLKYQEIATQLFISLNTVRTHAKNIFSKLNVNNRTLALAKARDLNLL